MLSTEALARKPTPVTASPGMGALDEAKEQLLSAAVGYAEQCFLRRILA